MFSFFLLLSIWLFSSGWFSQRLGPGSAKAHLLPLTFVLSCIFQFNIDYVLIAHVRNPGHISAFLLLIACFLMATALLVPAYRRSNQALFRDFLLPACKLVPVESKSIQRVFILSRLAVLVSAVALMLATQLFTATVLNWDSHWYNLARIPAMIIEHSVFPENTGSLEHLLFPIGHDLLYLLDITLLSLRGMGLVACLEFFVILGCLYHIALSLLSSLNSRGRAVKTQCALLLVTVLFVSSDLQVLQSVDPKNDLVIVMTFLISLSLSIERLLHRGSPVRYLLAILLVLIYSISSKSYGMIVLIPPFFVVFADVLKLLVSSSSLWIRVRESLRACVRDGLVLFSENRMVCIFVLVNALFIAATYVSHAQSVASSPHAKELAGMAAELSNVTGSLSDRLTNFALNTSRNFIAFVLYPYSTLRKWNANAPDDYFFGFGPLSGLMHDPRGLINATTIVRNIKADSAFGSIFLVPLIIILFCLLSQRLTRSRRGVQEVTAQCGLLLSGRSHFQYLVALIIMSCFLVFLFFSYALLNHSFGSKYLGPMYVPLIPLLSVAFAELIDLKGKIVIRGILLASLYSVLRLGFLLNAAIIPGFFAELVGSPSSLVVNQSPNLLYYQYVGSKHGVQETSRWLSGLSRLSSRQVHVLCFGAQAPSLTPLMYAIQSFKQGEEVDIRLSSHDKCIQDKSHFPEVLGKKVDYIFLH